MLNPADPCCKKPRHSTPIGGPDVGIASHLVAKGTIPSTTVRPVNSCMSSPKPFKFGWCLDDVPRVLCSVTELAACNASTETEVADAD